MVGAATAAAEDPFTMDLLQPAAHLVGMDSEETGQGGKIDLAREERVERAKPGAALAMAQRASEAIVQSTGNKITFD